MLLVLYACNNNNINMLLQLSGEYILKQSCTTIIDKYLHLKKVIMINL